MKNNTLRKILDRLFYNSAKIVDNPDGSWSLDYPDYTERVMTLIKKRDSELIKNNYDPVLKTYDYDGIAEDVLKRVEEN